MGGASRTCATRTRGSDWASPARSRTAGATTPWLEPDEIVRNADRLEGIPGWLIHGRLDVSSPLEGGWRINQAWPDSELIVVEGEGHGGDSMQTHWRRILAELA